METGKARRRGRSKSPETKRKIEFALDLLKNKPELIRPQLLSKVRAARIRQKYPFIHRSPESIKQSQANLLKRGAPPTGHVFLPYSVRDTSAPSCATKKEDKTYNYLANVDPRLVDFKIKNPATGKVDEVFTAAMIKRYRGKSSETEVAASGVAHEELPGASVLKRFREELGVSSETVTTDSSTPTTAVVRTSWTNYNPGRRFWGCPEVGSDCPFIDWVDPPMCPRAIAIIPGLLRGRNNLEANIRELQADLARSRRNLYISWIAFVLFVWFLVLT